MSAIKFTEEDRLFSKLVKLRSDQSCQYCHTSFKHDLSQLHCSHWKGRANKSTRYHPDNAFAHCVMCHDKLGHSPALFDRWVATTIGPNKADSINALSKRPAKLRPTNYAEIRAHFRKEIKRLENISQGESREFTVPHWYMVGTV